jgi:putative intracellular protease/amidase
VGPTGPSGPTGPAGATGPAGISFSQSKLTEVDFGALGVEGATFTVTDPDVTAASKMTGQVAYLAPTGKDLDELEFDNFDIMFAPGAGTFDLVVRALNGLVAGTYKIFYTFSTG